MFYFVCHFYLCFTSIFTYFCFYCCTIQGGLGLLSSTRIQSVVVPLLTTPQNILMKSQTGSGKTLAYLIPLLNDLMSITPVLKRVDGTRALIIAPTRELCSQIADVLNKLTQCCVWIVGGSITGGERKKSEKARLRKGVVVLVGTPGMRSSDKLYLSIFFIFIIKCKFFFPISFNFVNFFIFLGRLLDHLRSTESFTLKKLR